MKNAAYMVSALLICLMACDNNADSIVGAWQADKVNVSFDETRSTAELVRETGKIEKQNRMLITPDSTLLIMNGDDTLLNERLNIQNPAFLVKNDDICVRCEGSAIVTEEETPFGTIIVNYKKQK